MADEAAIFNPLVHVDMADGGEWEVQTENRDMIRWEDTAAKHKWPAFTVTPIKWQTFLAWTAGRREGFIPNDLTWTEFYENGPRLARSTRVVNQVPVDPTPPDPGID